LNDERDDAAVTAISHKVQHVMLEKMFATRKLLSHSTEFNELKAIHYDGLGPQLSASSEVT
jgi:hypothetical protein